MMFRARKSEADNPVEQAAAAARLKTVAGRGRDERALYPVREEASGPQPPRIRRLFWTPDELAEAQG